VVCEEVFTLHDIEPGVPIQTPVLPESRIDPENTRVKVTVIDCTLRRDQHNNFSVDLILMINKEITIKQPLGPDIQLEYGFKRRFTNLPITNCCPKPLPAKALKRLRCQIFDLEAEDQITLNTETNSFDEILTVTVVVKVVFEDQIPIPVTPTPIPPPPVPPEVLAALEIAAGKIRAQIGNPLFKNALLAEIARIQEFLLEGRVLEALALLTAVKEQVQHSINISPGIRIPFNLVLGDLIAAEKEIIALLL
jgi:hypothetical protein